MFYLCKSYKVRYKTHTSDLSYLLNYLPTYQLCSPIHKIRSLKSSLNHITYIFLSLNTLYSSSHTVYIHSLLHPNNFYPRMKYMNLISLNILYNSLNSHHMYLFNYFTIYLMDNWNYIYLN